jgi:hypothetical protein
MADECVWWVATLASGRTVGVEARRLGRDDWALTVGGVALPCKVEGGRDWAESQAWHAVVERFGMVREWLPQGEPPRAELLADLARLRAIEAAAGPAAAGVRHSLACERAPGTGCLCGLGALRAAVAGKGGA